MSMTRPTCAFQKQFEFTFIPPIHVPSGRERERYKKKEGEKESYATFLEAFTFIMPNRFSYLMKGMTRVSGGTQARVRLDGGSPDCRPNLGTAAL